MRLQIFGHQSHYLPVKACRRCSSLSVTALSCLLSLNEIRVQSLQREDFDDFYHISQAEHSSKQVRKLAAAAQRCLISDT